MKGNDIMTESFVSLLLNAGSIVKQYYSIFDRMFGENFKYVLRNGGAFRILALAFRDPNITF